MSTFTKFLSTAALALTVPLAAEAATLKTIDFDYGNGAGERNPFGDDAVRPDYALIADNTAPSQFIEIFDFSDLAGATIDSFSLSITYTAVTTATEDWFARVLGSAGSVFGPEELNVDLVDRTVADGVITQNITIDATSDVGSIDVFATALANSELRLRFREESNGDDVFRLHATQLVVEGTPAPVPLPASGLLLIGALGGVAAVKRRRKTA